MLRLKLAGVLFLTLLPGLPLAQNEPGTCSEDSRCNQGCCSKEGFCGFGPDFCGDDVCISDCDAMAECGGLKLRCNPSPQPDLADVC